MLRLSWAVTISNFKNKYQFTAKLKLEDETLELVDQAKLLGVMIANDLKLDNKTVFAKKKANKQMELLRKVSSFTKSMEDRRMIYLLDWTIEQNCD